MSVFDNFSFRIENPLERLWNGFGGSGVVIVNNVAPDGTVNAPPGTIIYSSSTYETFIVDGDGIAQPIAPTSTDSIAGLLKTSSIDKTNLGIDDRTAVTPLKLREYPSHITVSSRFTGSHNFPATGPTVPYPYYDTASAGQRGVNSANLLTGLKDRFIFNDKLYVLPIQQYDLTIFNTVVDTISTTDVSMPSNTLIFAYNSLLDRVIVTSTITATLTTTISGLCRLLGLNLDSIVLESNIPYTFDDPPASIINITAQNNRFVFNNKFYKFANQSIIKAEIPTKFQPLVDAITVAPMVFASGTVSFDYSAIINRIRVTATISSRLDFRIKGNIGEYLGFADTPEAPILAGLYTDAVEPPNLTILSITTLANDRFIYTEPLGAKSYILPPKIYSFDTFNTAVNAISISGIAPGAFVTGDLVFSYNYTTDRISVTSLANGSIDFTMAGSLGATLGFGNILIPLLASVAVVAGSSPTFNIQSLSLPDNRLELAQQGATDGQFMKWNDVGVPGAWGPGDIYTTGAISGSGATLADPIRLADGTGVGDLVQWDGTTWVVGGSTPTTGQLLRWTGTLWQPGGVTNTARLTGVGSAASPLDIAAQGATLGHLFIWNGTSWQPGGITNSARLTGIGNAAIPLDLAQQGAGVGQFLRWSGTSWAPGGTAVTAPVQGDGSVTSPIKLVDGVAKGQIYFWDTGSNSFILSNNIAPTDGQVLTWDNTLGVWKAAATILGPSATTVGQMYFWNGTSFILSNAVAPTDGQYLVWDALLNAGAGGWKASTLGSIAINDLADAQKTGTSMSLGTLDPNVLLGNVLAVGIGSISSTTDSTIFGHGCSSKCTNSIILGKNSVLNAGTIADNNIIVGSNSTQISTIVGQDRNVVLGNTSTMTNCANSINIGYNTSQSGSASCIVIGTGSSTSGSSSSVILGSGFSDTGGPSDRMIIRMRDTVIVGDQIVYWSTGAGGSELHINTSTRKNKTEIVDWTFSDIDTLRPVSYIKDGIYQVGLIAEEVYSIFPEMVCIDILGEPCNVDYTKLVIPLLNNAKVQNKIIKEYRDTISGLNTKVETLESRITEMQAVIDTILARL